MGGPERAPHAPRAPRPGGAVALRECRVSYTPPTAREIRWRNCPYDGRPLLLVELVFRDDHDGVAAGGDADAVAEAEEAVAEGAGGFYPHQGSGADVDLVDVAGALEDAQGHRPGNPGASRGPGVGEHEQLGT